jgi:hypothetical protein
LSSTLRKITILFLAQAFGFGAIQVCSWNASLLLSIQLLTLSPQLLFGWGFPTSLFIFVVYPHLNRLVQLWKSSTLKVVKIQFTTSPLLHASAWKWTSVKDSQPKLFLLVKVILGLRN